MNKISVLKRMMALFLTLALVIGLLPKAVLSVSAAEPENLTTVSKTADDDSFDNWRDYYGSNSLLPDGTRGVSTWKAGGVWTDKSVYTDSTKFPSAVTMDNETENFLIALSALASNKEIVGQSSTPTDTMLVLDLSQSMDNSGSVDDMINAANETIDTLLKMNVNNRIGVVLYSGNTNTSNPGYASSATVVLPLDRYTTTTSTTQWEQVNGRWTQVTKYQYLSVSGSSDTTVSVAQGTLNSNKHRPNNSKNTNGGTYIQNGLFKAWQEFENKTDKGVVQSGTQAGIQRKPILILMSDGRPTLATEDYHDVGTSNSAYGNGSENRTTWETVFLTQLTAAWVKGAIKDHYNNTAVNFYTLGLATGNDTYATGVLNPGSTTNSDVSTWWSNFQNGTNQNDRVLVEDNRGTSNDWYLPYDEDRFATGVGKNYVDNYWSAANVDGMIAAFKEIVAEIGLQSAYSATLVESGNADLDGYITVQDELGSMMQVKDVKGILLGNTLYSGVDFARGMTALVGTANGDEFVRSLKERLGIADTSVVQGLIEAAYNDGQLRYVSGSDYSNYIGWYGDANNGYLGFWDKDTGLTAEGAPAGAKYINRSYLYLGSTNHGGAESDMMHIVVLVRSEITTGHQTVLFRIPSALIPMVEYKVELEGDALEIGTEAKLTVTEADPIRLVYEAGLPDDVNSVNIEQKVNDYLAQDGSNHIHKDENGNYVFYANGWDNNHDNVAPIISDLTDAEKLELTQYVAESHFIPNTANERFYIQEDSVIYTKNGNSYTPVTGNISTSGTYYYARLIVTIINGTAQVVNQYEQLQPATIKNSDNFQRNGAGQWEVKAGTVRQQLSNVVLPKRENLTDTIANTDQLWVNVTSSDPSDYNIYSFLGNNGKLTVTSATGIKVSKDLSKVADGASATEEFEIQVLLDMEYSTSNAQALSVTDTNGNLLDTGKYSIGASLGKIQVTVYLADDESAVITGLPGGVTYTVTEAAHEKYTASYAGATATAAGAIVEGVVTNKPVLPGNLYITKEVVHAHGGEVFPTDHEFEFEVTFIDAAGNAIANTAFRLENNYDENLTELTTDENGVMTGKLRHGETVHIFGIPAGATVTVEEVNIPVNYTKTEYRSRNHSGADSDTDGVVTIAPEQNATVVVTNTYTPDKVGVDITFSGTKNFDATEIDVNSEFTFKLQEYKNNQWTDVEGEIVTVNKGENASESFAFDPLSLEFAEPGVHSYQIIEVKGNNTDITYDRSVYTFSVNVVIDEYGELKAEVTGHNEKENAFAVSGDSTSGYVVDTVFTNYYHKTATSIAIEKEIEDKANAGKTPAGFVIETYEATVDANGSWTIGELLLSTVTDAQGEALLVRNYDNTDFINNDTDGDNEVTYHFIIREKDEGSTGWTYDATEYRLTVILTKAADETISADFDIVKVTADGQETDLNVSGDTATIKFANTFDPADAEIDLNTLVKKELAGRDLIADEFTFAIFRDGEAQFDANGNLTNIRNALATGKNDAAGNVAFTPNKLTFTEIGKYAFDIVEVKGTKGGVHYDSTIYDLVVEVAEDVQAPGTLKATYYFEDSIDAAVTFRNTYTVEPTNVVIEGLKTLEVLSGAKSLHAGEYTFGLYNEAGTKIGETTNLANGTFKFDAITFDGDDIGKTYSYTVKELAPDGTTDGSYSAGGVSWSGQTFTVTVEVVDNGDGTLTAVVTGNGTDTVKFVNAYSSVPVSVSLPATKHLDGRDLKAGEFSYALYKSEVTFTDRELISDQITHDADGNITFSFGTLGMGYHYFVAREVIPEQRAAGIHYDANEYYITVQVTDNGIGHMSHMTTVKHSGDPNTVNPAIAFNNIYTPEAGQLPLSGTKTYNGGKALEDDVFSVGLYDSNGDLLDTADVKANGSFAFEALEYQAADVGQTYTYTIKEIVPDGAADNGNGTFTLGNNIYDGTVYTLTVSITDDDKDGALDIASVLTKDGTAAEEITFTNTFVPDPITHSIQATKTYEKGLKGGDFEFTLVSTDGKTNVDQTKKNDAGGDILFDAVTFTAAGEYKFKLTEKKDSIFSFILPSQAEYEITITVVNENGVLRISGVETVNTKNTGETGLEFINIYVLDGEDEITLRGKKLLTGDRTQVKANEFEFGLYDAGGKLIESVKNGENGSFVFATLKFDETDVPVNGSKQITYTVQEIAGDNARYTYDDTVYTIIVTVKDNDQGGVTATYTVNNIPSANAEITFTNSYKDPTPVTYTPMAKKNYNKTLSGGEFKFKLEGEINGTPVSQEKTNAAGGSITFDTLSFPEAGIYTFTVKEIDKAHGFIEYSAAEYTLVVNVVDTKGVLSLGSVTVNNDPDGTIEFTNTYVIDGEAEITLRGTKKLTGGRTTPEANEFEFGLYDAGGKLIESVKNDADGNFAFTTLKFDEKDVPVSGQKQITYTVKEIAGSDIRVTYDKTVYTVVVTVKDNERGGVAASYTVNNEADGLIAFTNIYTPKPEDITVDFEIVKTVVNKGSGKIGPEGFEFLLNAAAEGVADTTVKTDENGKAKFTLTFTEDDIGKTYTYKLTEVKGNKANVSYSTAEYTVTVAIALNENNKLVATLTKNSENVTAVVAAFENVYDYTPKDPDSPKTGDAANLQLWFAALFVSGGGIFGTALMGRKKKEETE